VILYRVALFRTDVSVNELSPPSGVLRLIRFHSCITAVTLLLSFSLEGDYYTVFWDGNTTVETYQLKSPEDGDSTFSETSVRNGATWHKVPADTYNRYRRESFPEDIVLRTLIATTLASLASYC
jgi:hypothetical protein